MSWSLQFPRLVRWVLLVGCILLVMMTSMRLVLFAAFNKQGNTIITSLDAFLLGLRYDLRVVAVVMLIMLLIGNVPALSPFRTVHSRKSWIWLLGILVFIMLFFYVVDLAHYAYLGQRLNASVLNYLQDAGISMNMVWQSYPVIKLTLGLLVVCLTVSWLIRRGYRWAQSKTSGSGRRNRIILYTILFLTLAFLSFGRFNQYPLRWSDAFSLGSDYKAGLALNPFESFFNTLKFRNHAYDVNKVKKYYPLLAPYFGWPMADSASLSFSRMVKPADSMPVNKPNVVLVLCESFSAYKSTMWNNPLNTTPFFDSISRRGIFFDRCFTPTYGTARGVWALLTGIPDVEMPKSASRNPTAVDQRVIMNDFKGYEKLYFIGGSPSWANIRGLLMNNIDSLQMFEEENLDAPRLDVWGISDKNLFLEANKILAKQSKPFLAVIQTADNHRPYTIPAEDTDFLLQQPSEDSLNRFGFKDQVSYSDKLKEYNAFRYTDYTFRKFMEAAVKAPYFDNTIFVFIGDHGIPGDAGELFPRVWTEQRLTSEHVPLLFYAPGLISPSRSSMICSQVDVWPTIAGLCKIPYTNTTLGRNLVDSSQLKNLAFIFDPDNNQAGIIEGEYFYRLNLRTGKDELFSIKNNQAPANPEPEKARMKLLCEGIYETSKYLLLNNKK